ncbi:thiosulfate dehydrogenase [Polymorphobacter multimanifer]|uniref:Thiosulfate dehydrogenase n=1 Tax=Polymorphobacter multimanifer TaxID=1070431 RepID=A0A841LB40_9SPHN|nr:c-type cytochrome [Polymorphobacter multimanifer]MBB6226372.1 thiosulfate dehydrogenase [Polymorphobacter multimanifer]
MRVTMALLGGLGLGAMIGAGAMLALRPAPAAPPRPEVAGFVAPLATTAPAGAEGDAIRLGARLITDTAREAPDHVGNGLACRNCHLDAGAKAGAAPLWAAFVNFPAFRKKNGEINSFQKRVQDCFLYSMNGDPPALGSRELLAIESYAAFMARGLPSGMSPAGRGFPRLDAPALPPDDARGEAVYAAQCSACHGAEGAGQIVDGVQAFPPLWGARSYNWGAGMATIDKAAAFIHANMPQGNEGSLTPQAAWDVAHYIDGKLRPQDPRFRTSAEATRARHHDQPFSRYGTMVGGERLGDLVSTPPAGRATG